MWKLPDEFPGVVEMFFIWWEQFQKANFYTFFNPNLFPVYIILTYYAYLKIKTYT